VGYGKNSGFRLSLSWMQEGQSLEIDLGAGQSIPGCQAMHRGKRQVEIKERFGRILH
jgi:hypothetical protein